MKFGQITDPQGVDFTIPADNEADERVFAKEKAKEMSVYVGCAKWNKTDLKNFYPKGTKDELTYYSTQFNCIELNATFYRLFPASTFEKWHSTTPAEFKFFPKLEQSISHFKRLKEVEGTVDLNVERFSLLKEKLGMPFLQMHNNFGPKDFDRVKAFAQNWKQYKMPLAMEFRHTDWFNDEKVSGELYDLLEKNAITNVLVDTAGRRDLMHMRMTTPTPFVRWVGANHSSDKDRLDEWVERIAKWKKQGMRTLYFFVHQNVEKESPLLAAHFIEKLNKKIGTKVAIPKTLSDSGSLF